ncbi:hypothetical protein FQR65_LT19917 [Abscondita terminalis]|nr:hypothetical protein FQR65_LT19917 [Abscondita terminalis]
MLKDSTKTAIGAAVCPVDCCVPDDNHVESEETLLNSRPLHGGGCQMFGKSTLFNCLSNAKAESANFVLYYRADIGVVKRTGPEDNKVWKNGLVKGASKGEGLGNQFPWKYPRVKQGRRRLNSHCLKPESAKRLWQAKSARTITPQNNDEEALLESFQLITAKPVLRRLEELVKDEDAEVIVLSVGAEADISRIGKL